MGSYIPGLDDTNAVNNTDGFSTGFITKNRTSSFNPVPPQGYMNGTQATPVNNTQQMPFINTQSIPMGNFQSGNFTGDQQSMPQNMNNNSQMLKNTGSFAPMADLSNNLSNNTQQMPKITIDEPSNIKKALPSNNNQMSLNSIQPPANNQMSVPSPMPNNTPSPIINQATSQIPIKIDSANNAPANLPINQSTSSSPSVPVNSNSSSQTNSPVPLKPGETKQEHYIRMMTNAANKDTNNTKQKKFRFGKKKKDGAEEEISSSKLIMNIVFIVIIVLLVIFIFLITTGKINIHKKKTTTPETPVTNPEQEKTEAILVKLNEGCNNLNDSGNYGDNIIDEKSSVCEELICFIDGNVICQNSICMIVVEDNVYTRTCSTGEVRVANKIDFQAKVNLDLICEVLVSSPELNGTYTDTYATCSNYECVTSVEGKDYNRNCKGNS